MGAVGAVGASGDRALIILNLRFTVAYIDNNFGDRGLLKKIRQGGTVEAKRVYGSPASLVTGSAFAKVLARIIHYRRVAIWMAKWRYGGRGAPGERSESQSRHGVRGQRPRGLFFRASI